MKILLCCAVVSALSNEGSYPALTPAEIAKKYPPIEDEYIVVFKPEHTMERIQSHLSAVKDLGCTVHREWSFGETSKEFRGYHVTIENSESSAAMDFIKSRFENEVAFVEQNGEVLPDGESFLKKRPKTECLLQSGATWGIARTSTVQNTQTGFYPYGYPGKSGSVDVYVIDTGVRTTHKDFQGRAKFGADMWYNPPMTTGDLSNGFRGI
jgi:hypothetical protein